jgi:uncharacterized membrane protein
MERIETVLVAIVGVLIVLTAIGLWILWPTERFVAEEPADLYTGTVTQVEEYVCPEQEFVFLERTGPCQIADIEILDGPAAGTVFTIDSGEEDYPAFRTGDRVRVGIAEMAEGEPLYFVADFARGMPLAVLFVLFVATVVAIGRWHGVRSLVGLGLSLALIVVFVVPAILAGERPFLVAVVGAFAIMVIILYLAHGFTIKTTSALVGTAAALGLTAVLGVAFVHLAQLTGFASEEARYARFVIEGGLDLRGLILAGLIIGALGVLNDVTVSQASTAFEVHGANPAQSFAEVFRRSMSVGRDHIAAVVNTLALAYVGAALPLLVLLSGFPMGEVAEIEVVAEEIVRTLVGSIGLVAAVPFTTALAAMVAVRQPQREDLPLPAHLAEDADEAALTDDEIAHRRWVEFLRTGSLEDDAPGLPSEPDDERR